YAISKLKSKGFYVLGYVYTSKSQRNIDEVKNDINNWLSFYPNMIDGFFVDEVVNGTYNYYSSIHSYIKALNKNFYVVLNPGAVVDSSYWTIADKIVVFEDSYNRLLNYNYTFYSQPSSNVCMIIYGIPDKNTFYNVLSKALSLNSSCQYITNYSLNDLYFRLSDYLNLF
ncbi:spherulation-specific family 4 protein, partial [Sulfurihydrogenibium sp.]|uniref:spherulation-specific family 4 protein n=1 Tax=Sulfurihydrogenibium sp. TaxID=2053621 RepID=UPI003D0F5B88